MAARDRWDYGLKCPKCGATGRAFVSEDDHPWMRDPHFRVDSIEGEFYVETRGRSAADTTIACKVCKVAADGD